MNGGMNTTIIEEDKNWIGQGNNSRQELYTTAFVTPLRNFKENGLPWPFAAIFDSLQDVKWLRIKNETGFAVSAACMAAIIFGSVTERTLLNLLLISQAFAVKMIPYSLIVSLFFWTGAYMRRKKWAISWKITLCLVFAVELLSDLLSRSISLTLANLIGLAAIFLFCLVHISKSHDYATACVLFLLATTRFLGIGLLLQISNQPAGHPALLSYLACFVGFSLGYLLNSSSQAHNSLSDTNDILFGNKIPVIRKRRGSSVDSSVSGISAFSASAAGRRRTSMPLLGLPNRVSAFTIISI